MRPRWTWFRDPVLMAESLKTDLPAEFCFRPGCWASEPVRKHSHVPAGDGFLEAHLFAAELDLGSVGEPTGDVWSREAIHCRHRDMLTEREPEHWIGRLLVLIGLKHPVLLSISELNWFDFTIRRTRLQSSIYLQPETHLDAWVCSGNIQFRTRKPNR